MAWVLLDAFVLSPAVSASHGGITGDILGNNTATTESLISWLNGSQHSPTGDDLQAYINWVFLDEQFKTVTTGGLSGADPVDANSETLKLHNKTVNITKNGYLYVYCSNESVIDVFFDNLQVIHTRGPLLEETHYYPFGLTMNGISSTALSFGTPENKRLFNKGSELQNKEFSDGSGLELYATNFRSLDPQLGRWWQVDSKPDMPMSPYSAMNNNPILYNDPLGDTGSLPQTFYIISNEEQVEGTEHFQLATDQEWRESKWGSLANDLGYYIADFLGFTALDNAFSTVQDENASITEKFSAVLGAGLATTRGEGEGAGKVPVQKYEVGIFSDLKSRSQPYDGLDIHHTPQSHPAGQVIPGYDKLNAPSIALPSNEHQSIPTLKGNQAKPSARAQLAKDIFDLRKNTSTPVKNLQQLIDLNKKLYPYLFNKK